MGQDLHDGHLPKPHSSSGALVGLVYLPTAVEYACVARAGLDG